MSEYTLEARLNENALLRVSTDSLVDMAQALAFFKLIDAAPPAVEPAVEETPAPKPVEVAKRARKKLDEAKAEPAATPTVPETAPEAPAPAETAAASPSEADEGNAAAAPSAPEAAAASSASSPAPAATPADAAEAVRGYGARHGIAAARELLQKFGFARTGDITADKAGELAQAAQE